MTLSKWHEQQPLFVVMKIIVAYFLIVCYKHPVHLMAATYFGTKCPKVVLTNIEFRIKLMMKNGGEVDGLSTVISKNLLRSGGRKGF